MKVKGTQTKVEAVEITLTDEEVIRVANSLDVNCLATVMRDKLFGMFIQQMTDGRKGDFFISARFLSKNNRNLPETGEGTYLTLIERDADWDYHKNVGVDEEIRPLTKEEVDMYNAINKIPTDALSLFADLEK